MITAKKTVQYNGDEYLIQVHDWSFYTIWRGGEFVRPEQTATELRLIAWQIVEEANERRDEIQATGPQWVQL